MRFVDLSATLEDDRRWAPRWARTVVRYQGHRFGRFAVWVVTRLTGRYLRTGLGWANEVISLSTHSATHMDAPWHYAPTSMGQPARTIDQVPLDWCYGPGVVLDLRDKGHGAVIDTDDVQAALAASGHALRPGDIVLVQTGNDRLLGTPAYFTEGPGVSAAATRWLLAQGVRVVGIDAWGWDGPLGVQAERARAAGRADVFWAAHYVGVDQEYCQLERLINLDALPPNGFTVCAFPLKVRGGSAGPARVVALLADPAD